MDFEPIYNSINVSTCAGEISEQIKAECKTDIPTNEISSVLSVSAFSVITDTEILNGKIKYNGRVIFYVCYLNTDGEINKSECGSEFSGIISSECVTEACSARVSAIASKTDQDQSGIKLSLSAILTVKANLSQKKEATILAGGNDLIVDKKEVPIVKSLGTCQNSFFIEDEFELNYAIKEVLSHRASAVVTGVQCGVGSLIVDGEVFLSMIALQNNEKRDIIRENKTLPFRMEIECDDAMPTMFATAFVSEKSFKTDISVDEDKGISLVSVSVNLSFTGEAFVSDSVELALDAFSTEREIELKREQLPFERTGDLVNCACSVFGTAVVEQLPVGAVLFAVGGEKTEIISTENENQKIKVTGVLSATGFFCDEERRTFTRKLEAPFETQTDCPVKCGCECEVLVKTEHATARITALDRIELEAELFLTVYPKEKSCIEYVKEVAISGEKQKCESAISVYIPFEGEDLWSLSKRLNVCPESLVATNKELNFPLTGKERIVIYRQK